MRVVAGKYKRRNLSWPSDVENIRPTKDRIKEALFSALGDLENKVVLDLYAGSGALGIEALSRNAKFAYFVDNNKIAIDTIKNNTNFINENDYKILFKEDAFALEWFKKNNISFDLVLLDPPYKKGRYSEVISYLINNNLINNNGIIVCESDHYLDEVDKTIFNVKDYKYGDIYVSIYERK